MKQYLQELFYRLVKIMPFYKKAKRVILGEYNEKYLEIAVYDAIENVPFYSDYGKYKKDKFSIIDFPIIRKTDVVGKEKSLVSKKYCTKFLHKVETGGSTGVSLELFYSYSLLQRKNIVSDYAFSLIGEDLNIAVLRGNKTDEGQLMKKVNNKKIILSSYHLTESNLDEYIEYLKQYKINCLHVYPSSLSIFARLIKAKYGQLILPDLKGILASSEIFSREEKILVKEVFPNVKIVDYYGHNELACCAIAEDLGYYKFFNNFGYVEFIDTGDTINGNRIAEIVVTSIVNDTMPFIRYATDDYVELDANGNVISIIGRTSDFLVNKNKQLSPCIVLTRTKSMQSVINFQYFQDRVGEMEFRVVVNDNFNEEEKLSLLEDLNNSFNSLIDCKVVVVDKIEKTKAGKQKRLIQFLDINNYK